MAVTRRYALATDSSVDTFQARADFTLTRYDAWTSGAPLVNTSVPMVLRYQLRDAVTDAAIPLANADPVTGWASESFNSTVDRFFPGNPTAPSVRARDHTFDIELAPGTTLDPDGTNYYLAAELAHQEFFEIRTANRDETADQQLLFFNGSLHFAGTNTIFNSITNNPSDSIVATGAGTADIDLTGIEGFLSARPDHSFDSAGAIRVRLGSDGVATVISAVNIAVDSPPGSEEDVLAGITFTRTNLRLDSAAGLSSEISVRLPAGMGVAESGSAMVLEPSVSFSSTSLDNNLAPVPGQLTYSAGGGSDLHVQEESKPVLFACDSLQWNTTQGTFTINDTAINSTSFNRINETELLADLGLPLDETYKASNDAYFANSLSAGSDITIRPGAKGSAKMDVEINFGPLGLYRAHFPYLATFPGAGGGKLTVVSDISSGTLDNVGLVGIPYATDCAGVESCFAGTAAPGLLQVDPEGDSLSFTPDGGLVGAGPLDGEKSLRWGFRGKNGVGISRFAHSTGDFGIAQLVISGHQIQLGIGPTAPDEIGKPDELLLTAAASKLMGGIQTPDSEVPLRPFVPAYLNGSGFHPGINLRASAAPGAVTCDSLLGDAKDPVSYVLSDCSRYFARQAGVSGVHQADDSTPLGMTELYGYPITIDSFLLGFQHSENIASASSGSLTLPFPTDETFAFEELLFDCLGGLKSATPPFKAPRATLDHWNDAQIDPLTIVFGTSESPACPDNPRDLLIGVRAFASHFDQPFFGTLGFDPLGRLLTAAEDSASGINSRLDLPNVLTFDGPGDERYTLTTQADAYYSRFGEADPGHLNVFGSLDVAFFQNIPVHLGIQGKAGDTLSPLRLTGQWEDGAGLLPIDEGFDRRNVGGIGLLDTHFDNGGAHPPTAQHSWFNVIDFNYPLDWDDTRRAFESPSAQTTDLVVLKGEHQVRYLSSRQADIKFGVLYDGLPEINLAGVAYDIVAEGSGVLQSVRDAAGDAVADVLNEGLSELDGLVADVPADLVEKVLADRLDALYSTLYDELAAAHADAATFNLPGQGYRAVIDSRIRGIAPEGGAGAAALRTFGDAPPVDNILGLLNTDLLGSIEWETPAVGDFSVEGFGMMADIDFRLATLENSIRALVGDLPLNAPDGIPVNLPPIPDIDFFEGNLPAFDTPGLFSTDDLTGDLPAIEPLIAELLANLSSDLLGNLEGVNGPGIPNLQGEIDAYLERMDPVIQRLQGNLERIRSEISQIRESLTDGSDIEARIRAIVGDPGDPSDALIAVTDQIAAQVEAEIARLIAQDIPFPELSREEFIALGRRITTDRLIGSVVIPDIGAVLRAELAPVEDILYTNIDSLFAQVNDAIRDLLTEYLVGVDLTSTNEFIGDLNGIVGGGELQGYASIRGDTLRKLRLDLAAELNVPDTFVFDGYIEVNQEQAGNHVEVLMGADHIPVGWSLADDDTAVDIGLRFGFDTDPVSPTDIGGGIDLAAGKLSFSEFDITTFSAVAAIGQSNNYLGAGATLVFESTELEGAFFFGQSDSMDPLDRVASDASDIIGNVAPFVGGYVYGRGHIPIVGSSCFFNISAGVGAGIWYFDGPTDAFGGRMDASVSGEALCTVSVRGEVDLIGTKVGNDFNFRGTGRVSGKAGPCPFCVRFRESVTLTYENGDWDADY